MRVPRRLVLLLTTAALIAGALLAASPVAPPPSASAAVAAPDASIRLEQNDARLRYTGTWGTLTNASDSGGSSTYLASTGSVTLTFHGTRVAWLGRTTPSGGTASVSIDGGSAASVSRFSSTTKYQQTAFDSGQLAQGQHTIRISWTSKKPAGSTGASIPLDALVVHAPGVGVHQETDPAIRLSAGWTNQQHSQDSGGSGSYASRSRTGEVSASFSFVGNSISWIGRTTSSSGIASVKIDGVPVGTVDRYSPTTRYQQNLFTWTDAAPGGGVDGLHTVTVTSTPNRNTASSSFSMYLDAFAVSSRTADVTGVTATPTPASANALTDGNGVQVSWTDPLGPATTQRMYQVLRAENGGPLLPIAVASQSPYVERGLLEDTDYQYAVQPIFDFATSATSPAGAASAPAGFSQPSLASRVPAVAECSSPATAATPPVRTSLELQAAFDAAGPGTIIVLASNGSFPNFPKQNVPAESRGFILEKSGTANAPIVVCGKLTTGDPAAQAPENVDLNPQAATLDMNGAAASRYTDKAPTALTVRGAHIRIAGINVRDAFVGIDVRGSTDVRIDGVHVANTGQGGIYLRGQEGERSETIGASVVRSSITAAGQRAGSAAYGEGIYVGHSLAAGCNNPNSAAEGTDCFPDRTRDYVLAYNRITETAAQAIEIKEQTSNGFVYRNELGTPVDQAGFPTQITDATMTIKGSDALVYGNAASARLTHGIQALYGTQYDDRETTDQVWGERIVFAANSVAFVGGQAASQSAFTSYSDTGNTFRCSNSVSGTPPRELVTSVPCAP